MIREQKYLEEDSEVDNGDSGGDEHGLESHDPRVNKENESEGYSTSQTTIRHHKLVHFVKFVQSELVHYSCQDYNT